VAQRQFTVGGRIAEGSRVWEGCSPHHWGGVWEGTNFVLWCRNGIFLVNSEGAKFKVFSLSKSCNIQNKRTNMGLLYPKVRNNIGDMSPVSRVGLMPVSRSTKLNE